MLSENMECDYGEDAVFEVDHHQYFFPNSRVRKFQILRISGSANSRVQGFGIR